ncbi:MAG TPA: transglycosylase SLT domain-containing protein [Spongiibacteraceae bacterium]
MAALKNYPLYPYLQAQQLSAAIARGSSVGIDEFFAQQGDSVAAEQLRNQWLAFLAENKAADNDQWAQFLQYYRAANASKLQQCWFIEALHRTDQKEQALRETGKIWLTTDMPDACDSAFKRWLDSDQRNEILVWKRLQLALERKQETLARFLAVQIREPYKLQAEYALLLYREPAVLNNLLPQIARQPEASATIALALKNFARSDIDNAQTLWLQTKTAGQLSNEDSNAVRREIGRLQIALNGPDALPWLLQFDPNGEDSYLLEWRLRLALRNGDWPQIEQWIGLLSPEIAQTARWNYWRARALAVQNDSAKQKQAADIFAKLAKERSYYGFLAADLLKTNYQLNDEPIAATADIDTVAQLPAILRAREFFMLGEQLSARREWQSALRAMSIAEQQTAALLAAQWDWYDQSIRSATQSGSLNDLRLRFPIGYRESMVLAAKNTTLPLQWLFAITRQESAFMADARSPVGALGLMQLMPATARQIARNQHAHISIDQLLQPETNIRLGSTYLRDLWQRYNGNRVLATAAYNAGPNRIGTILRTQTSALSTDVWVENLPYRETREYVQSVLAFAVIYAQRLGQPAPLLNKSEREIDAPALQVGSSEKN